MLEIRAHLDVCPACRGEYQTLRDTKRLLAALAMQAPRTEFEALLRAEVERVSGPFGRWMPAWRLSRQVGMLARPTPLFAAAALLLAALFFATGKVDTPADMPVLAASAPTPDLYPPL